MNLTQFDHEQDQNEHEDKGVNSNPLLKYDHNSTVNLNFQSYLEGKLLTFTGENGVGKPTIWLKPNFVAPQGYHLWIAGLSRKVSVVTKAEYLNQVRGILTTSKALVPSAVAGQIQTTVKNYTSEITALEKGKYHIFGKFDF